MFMIAATNVLAQSLLVRAASDLLIYDDSLAGGWWDGSWDTNLNLNNMSQHQSGSVSASAAFSTAWGGVYFGTSAPQDATNYSAVRFWIHGGSSGSQHIAVKLIDAAGSTWNNSFAITPTANVWTPYTITLTSFGITNTIGGVAWQDTSGSAQPIFYLDNITLVAAPVAPPPPPALSVDVSANRHAISPYIYGMNFADAALAAELQLPVDRYGGNATTRYNYLNDTANRASDWFFENIPNNTPGGVSESDAFVNKDRGAGAKTILTMPLIGWTPKDNVFRCGFSIAIYGAQQSSDNGCGNGVWITGTNVSGNNPLDTSLAITESFDAGWVHHLVSSFDTAGNGGVMFYDLDNEPMLWNSTHRDAHPNPTSYDEMRTRTYAYAPAIKAGDPSAKTLGPALWGWSAYFDSAVGGSDRSAHGNTPFVDWYLQQMRSYEITHGVRVLDYLDLHYYPQAPTVALEPAGNAYTQSLRLRSTRSLWDPTYIDESWIAGTSDGPYVRLIPRMRDWVSNNYSGTKIALGEYNWGALDDINGALTEAELLGIFGRESLDLAALWDPPSTSQPGAFAFRMYRSYDGTGGMFGATSVSATSTVTDTLSVFAAQRSSDNAVTILVINKTAGPLTTTLSLKGFAPAPSARVYRYSKANLGSILPQADQAVSASGFVATYPASSITLFVIPSSTTVTPRILLPVIIR